MKKIVGYVVFYLSLFLLTSSVVYAEDGSLKINTDIQSSQQSKEINYIEQISELSSLFRVETTLLIKEKQDILKEQDRIDRDNFFTNESTAMDSLEQYKSVLFHAKTVETRTDRYHISLNATTQPLSWQMIIVIVVAFMVMLYSMFRGKLSKKG